MRVLFFITIGIIHRNGFRYTIKKIPADTRTTRKSPFIDHPSQCSND